MNAPQELPIAQVLDGIDREIARRSADQQRPGWTNWALWTALALVIWAATEEYKAGIAAPRFWYWLLGVRLLVLFLENSAALMHRLGQPARWPPRFEPAGHQMPDSFPRAILAAAEAVVVSYLLLFLLPAVGTFARWSAIFIVAGTAAGYWLLFFMARNPGAFVPRGAFAVGVRAIKIAIYCFVAIMHLLTAICIVRLGMDLFEVSSPSPVELRLALLANAAVWIIFRLAPAQTRDRAIEELNELRTNLAFGRVDSRLAAERAVRISLGWQTHEVLEGAIHVFVQQVQELTANLSESEDLLTRAELAAKSAGENEEAQKTAAALFELSQRRVGDAMASYRVLGSRWSSLVGQCSGMTVQGGDLATIKSIRTRGQFDMDALDKRIREMIRRTGGSTKS